MPLETSTGATGRRVVLRPRRAQPFFGRHPWVFSGAIHAVEGQPAPGDEVELWTHDHEFIARGLYNPHGNIRLRLYTWLRDERLDAAFWSRALDRALALRESTLGLMGPGTAARLVNSEGDGLSGLIVDRYDAWLIVQFTSLAMAARRELLVDLLERALRPAGVWLRTERGIRQAEGLEIADGHLRGGIPPQPLFIHENGLRFAVDVVRGQKTGFFLDQRENRRALAGYLRGGTLLDLCCYTGGFALNAARHGAAAEILAVDSSEPALSLARANALANGLDQRIRFEKADAFLALEQLKAAGKRFDAVVLDPPKLSRQARSLADALRGYHGLNRLALDVLSPGGILATCSCSGHVSRDMFAAMLADAATSAGRGLQILELRGAAPDHPVSVHCPEGEYLKCAICRVT